MEYSIYCDESCHLEHDHQTAMVLGSIWVPTAMRQEIYKKLRHIKEKHGLSKSFEAKWVKVSPTKANFYLELIKYFFDEPSLHYRGLIIPDKSVLNHGFFAQDHDTWYYKMYFNMLKAILKTEDSYRIYIDIKDTKSADKVKKLHDVLSKSIYDFPREIVKSVQTVRSEEIEIMQLTDLITGAISYTNRHLHRNEGKNQIIKYIMARTGYKLVASTLLREEKFNLFVWHPAQAGEVQ